jgi:GNAT superfamily N-acetyltransferase
MHALSDKAIGTAPLQSVTIRWVDDETSMQMLVDDLMARTEYSETWPFMDWVEEAAADQDTRLLGAFNTDTGQWAGFIAFRSESQIKPDKPGKALVEAEVSIESLYVTEEERRSGIGTTLMQLAIDFVNASIQALRAKHMLLKLDIRINFIADCFSEPAFKIASNGLEKLCALQAEKVSVQNQVTLAVEDA